MRQIEIYGLAGSDALKAAEEFCVKAKYSHAMRPIEGHDFNRSEYERVREFDGALPQLFIGTEQIGSLHDLMSLKPYIVQQKISG